MKSYIIKVDNALLSILMLFVLFWVLFLDFWDRVILSFQMVSKP